MKTKDNLDIKLFGTITIISSSFSFHATPKIGDPEITLEHDWKVLTVLER